MGWSPALVLPKSAGLSSGADSGRNRCAGCRTRDATEELESDPHVVTALDQADGERGRRRDLIRKLER